MAQTQSVELKIQAILDAGASVQGLKDLKKLQKEVGAGSKEFKLAQQGINDFTDGIKGAKTGSEDLIGNLSSLPGPLGRIAGGVDKFQNSTNKLKFALFSLGLPAIIALVGALTSAFSQNEKITKKLEPLFIAFEQILGGVFAALEPVIDAMISLAVKAMPMVSNAVKTVYSGVVALLQSLGKLGSALMKVFSGDFSGALDDAKSAFTDFGKNYETATKNFEKGSKELTKTEKENAEKRTKALEEEAQKRKAVVDAINAYIQKGVEARGKTQQEELADAKTTYNKLLADAKKYGIDTASITTAYNEQVAKINKTFADKAKEDAQKDFDLKLKNQLDGDKLILDQLKANLESAKVVYGDGANEVRKAQDDIFKAQEKGLNNERALLEGKKELTDAEKLRLEQIKIDQQNLTTAVALENKKRFDSDLQTALKTSEEGKKVRDQEFADRMKAAEGDLVQQQALLDAKKALDEQYYAEQLAREGLNAEQIKALKEKQTADTQANADAQIAIETKKFQAQQALFGATANALNALADIVGKNTVAGKALAVAASLINTYAAIAGQLRAFAGLPIPGYAIVQAVATGLVGFKAVADIIKTPVPAAGGSGSGGGSTPASPSGPSVPKPRGLARGGFVSGPGGPKSDLIPAMLSNGESVINAQSTSMFKPLLSSINAIGGGKRFADGGLAVGSFSQDQALKQLQDSLSFQQQAPIKTYVVASDMTNQQMMDRDIKTRSTI